MTNINDLEFAGDNITGIVTVDIFLKKKIYTHALVRKKQEHNYV